MTIFHSWRPWVAGATVLAIAAVSAFAGWWISKDEADAAGDVRTLPVLGPIGYGDEAPSIHDEDGSMIQSPVQGTREVPFVDGEPQLQSDQIEAILDAPDPGELIATDEPAGSPGSEESSADDGPMLYLPNPGWIDLSGSFRRDDPCAPAGGEPVADDCPDGEPGTIGAAPATDSAPAPASGQGGDRRTGSDDGVGAGRSGLVEEPGVPPTSIRGLTAYTMVLSAAHRSDVRIGFNVQVLEPAEQPDCTEPAEDLPLADSGESSGTKRVDEAWLRERGYDTSYTKRTTMVVMVPEGSRILGCIAEYDADRHSWDWFEAQRRTWRVLESPDVNKPSISVDSVSLSGDLAADAVSVSVLWPNGRARCQLVEGPSVVGNTMDPGDYDQICAGDEFGITGGDATISTYVEYDGTATRTHSVLPLASLGCPACLIPPSTWYSIPLKIETGPVEMCGSGIQAPCDPLKAREAVGTVRLKVDWEYTSRNPDGWQSRQERWTGTEYVREDVDPGLDPLPQI